MITMIRRVGLVLVSLCVMGTAAHAKPHHKAKGHHGKKMHAVHKPSPSKKISAAKKQPSVPAPSIGKDIKDEKRLVAMAKRIDRETRHLSLDTHVELVANRYHVALSVVEDLQKSGMGWGDISISLAMANDIRAKDRINYPTPADALNRVQNLRSTSPSWRETAMRAGIPLHPIVAAASRSYVDLVATNRREQPSPTATLALNH